MRVKILVTPKYLPGTDLCCQASVTVTLPGQESGKLIWLDDQIQSDGKVLGYKLRCDWGGNHRKTLKTDDGAAWVSSTGQYWFCSWNEYEKGVDKLIKEIHQTLKLAKEENLSMIEQMPPSRHIIADI
ncbi:MAG: hypothetical protein Fur0042_12620 [Cyanophyceae cyanobacterium]